MNAFSPVIGGCAVRIESTGPFDAWIPARVVGKLAVFDVTAVVILHTLQDWYAHTYINGLLKNK